MAKHDSDQTSANPASGHGGRHDAVPTTDKGRTSAADLLRGGQQGRRDSGK